jgi:signal recognition particle subunit SRP19
MAKRSKRIIWPVYIDAQKTRKAGRILAKKDSVSAPDCKEIVKAAKELDLNPSYEGEKSYPRLWWEHKGRVLIDVGDTKRQAMRQIALKIKLSRASDEARTHK